MYASHLRSRRIDPVGLGGATLIGGAILAALINIAPHISLMPIPKTFTADSIPEVIPPPPVDQRVEPKKPVDAPAITRVVAPPPLIQLPPTPPTFTTVANVIEPPPALPGIGTGEGVIVEPPALPALIGAELDRRYADDFQPPYPGPELRAEMEGVITVRVQIGTDGRVKAIEPVGKPNTGFFNTTRKQALSSWRFKPATRGGVPVESWKTMTVRFQIS